MKKHISEFIISIVALLYGVFLLLAGLDVFPFTISEAAFISTCVCLLASSAVVFAVQRNPIGLFFAVAFAVLTLAATLLLVGFTSRNVYPLYIASVFAGGAVVFATKAQLRRFSRFSLAALGGTMILMLESFGALKTEIVLPILVIYLAFMGIIYALLKLKDKGDKEEA